VIICMLTIAVELRSAGLLAINSVLVAGDLYPQRSETRVVRGVVAAHQAEECCPGTAFLTLDPAGPSTVDSYQKSRCTRLSADDRRTGPTHKRLDAKHFQIPDNGRGLAVVRFLSVEDGTPMTSTPEPDISPS
jgi:hypothetical protein